jgi:cellulose synthase/poly-beta-1,6-N-acetylglucosamine synthase-like glycosyltransferase
VVTIQLPLYNEMYVADRLIEAVCRIEYPREKLEIQVLDDSTDETRGIAELAVRRFATEGIDIKYLHRTGSPWLQGRARWRRPATARGEFVAIFDADFIPTSDFLTRLMPHFSDAKVAMVQARWGHINQDYSLLTKIQSILLDGHFVLEHGGRHRSGRFFNFNGTAGIWRRVAIDDGGGWQHDTLTEDLDLSYRTQLRGWRFVFVSDVIAPAEVPVEMNAFKSQQFRWAKGSIQTCRKLLPRILRADLPLGVKAEAFFHLTANFNYPFMCVLSVLMFPAMVIRYNMGWYEMLLIDVPLFFAATFSVCNFYMVCQREIHTDWRTRIKYLPFSDVDRHRLVDQQHARGHRSDFQQAERIHANAEVSHRARQRRMGRQEISSVGRGAAADRARAGTLLHLDRVSTPSPTRSTARCRSWSSSRLGSSTPACSPSSSSTRATRTSSPPGCKKLEVRE